MVGAVAAGDQARAVELVEARLLEADREGLHPRPFLARGERRQPGRVDAAGEQHPDRDVGDQVGADRVAQRLAQLPREAVDRAAPGFGGGDRARARVALPAHLSAAPGEQRARGQLARLGEDRQRRRDRVEGEIGGDGPGVDLAREAGLLQHRLQLGGEGERPVRDAVVEGLDPEAVAGEQQAPLPGVPERDREHAPQPLEEAVAVLLVEMDEDLGVAVGGEPVPEPLQLLAQLAVVVDLAVLDDRDRPVLVGDRLVAVLEVDDREAPGGKSHAVGLEEPVAVRPAMDEPGVHPPHPVEVRACAALSRGDAANPTHGRAVSQPSGDVPLLDPPYRWSSSGTSPYPGAAGPRPRTLATVASRTLT